MRRLLIILLCSSLATCAQIPPQTVLSYSLPRAKIHAAASQVLSCSNDRITTEIKGLVTVIYYPDDKRHHLRLNDFSSALNDVDMTVSVTNDGRLKAFNSSFVGQAAAVSKGAGEFSSDLEKAGLLLLAKDCKNFGMSDGQKITVSYSHDVDFPYVGAKGEKPVPPSFKLQPQSSLLADTLLKNHHIRELRLITSYNPVQRPYGVGNSDDGKCDIRLKQDEYDQYICARDTAILRTTMIALGDDGDGNIEVSPQTDFVVPRQATYPVAIGRSATFGKATTKLGLNDAGGLTDISYSKTSSVVEWLGAAGGLAVVAATAR